MAALRRGNMRKAVELLFAAYQDDLYAYCARLVGPGVALQIYQRILHFAVGELAERGKNMSLRAWLFSLARRVVTHQHFQEQRPLASSTLDYAPVDMAVDVSDDNHVNTAADAAMRCLDPPTREVLQLSLWHGLTLDEVALVIERPADVVRKMASQGLSRMAMYAIPQKNRWCA